ncbi:hypothetical protein, partial [Comamonas jiangduensis]|uniref:hypothetical protein n=1 Tax=Comamonas jiangduensis TaxID=1194168 RepID=UPI003D663F67
VLCGLFVAASLGSLQVAHAFEQATPPAGWSAGGGPGGSVTGTKAVNAMFANGGVTSNASIRASGRLVTMPALMKYTANAPRVAAAAIMLHPGIRTAASIAGWLGLAALFYDEASGLWQSPNSEGYPQSTGQEYSVDSIGTWHLTVLDACNSAYIYNYDYKNIVADGSGCYVDLYYKTGGFVARARTSVSSRNSSCPSGWYVTPAGCVQTPPPKTITQEEAIEEIIKHPMPDDAPKYIPEPLPVEMPYFEPLFIPTGNPVANPKYDPSKPLSPENQPYVQPGTKVTPAPAPGAPWQVDTVPVNRPTPTPEGSTEPSTEP